MATKHADAGAGANATTPPVKSNKKLFLIIGLVVVLVLGGGVAFLMLNKKHTDDGQSEAPVAHSAPVAKKVVDHNVLKTPPVYLPLDNMVVNLADEGGEKVAQVGIVFELSDAKSAESVKAYLPTIRSGVLILLSQRTSSELLSADGKQKLIDAILREASVPFGGDAEDQEEETSAKKKKKRRQVVEYPVTGVLFSSLVIQ